MRQFFIASGTAVVVPSDAHVKTLSALTDLGDGQVAFATTDSPVVAFDSTKVDTNKKECQILLGVSDVNGKHGWESFPFFANHLSYSVMTYAAAKSFRATVKVAAPTSSGPHTLIIAKKGVQFNERNKWSVDTYVKEGSGATAADVAKALAKAINDRFVNGTIQATVATDTITITSSVPATDYEVLAADELSATITITHAEAGRADKAMIIDLANKAIADRGVNDTCPDAGELMHPRYPITRGTAALAEKYDVITMRFAEPRAVKTRDEVVHQIIQIAIPRGDTAANAQVKYITDVLDAFGASKL